MEDNYYEEAEYASFWLRLAAYIIDAFIINIALYIVMLIFGISVFASVAGTEMLETGEPDPAAIAGIAGSIMTMMGLAFIGSWLYYALLESSEAQATLGKRAVRLRVTDLDGDRISFGRATGRYFGKILSGLVFMIGYIMALFTERKQALHDIIAGTIVLRDD